MVTGALEPGNHWSYTVDHKAKILSTIHAMTNAFHKGDIDGILRTYEPGAVVVGEPRLEASEERDPRDHRQPDRQAPEPRRCPGGAGGDDDEHEDTDIGECADDVALHLTPWRMAGVAPDGTALGASGLSVAVLRRQPDGHWLMVIDDPHGDALLEQRGDGRAGGRGPLDGDGRAAAGSGPGER